MYNPMRITKVISLIVIEKHPLKEIFVSALLYKTNLVHDIDLLAQVCKLS